jgi:hypothetical protein
MKGCSISLSQKFIFIHVMKNGGSSMHQFLQESLCAPSFKFRSKDRPPPEPWRTFYFNCSADQLKITYCFDAYRDHPEFFKWTFVRHPYERAVSAWAMASREAQGSKIPFDAWVLNASLMPTATISMHWWPQSSFLTDAHHCPVFDFAGTVGQSINRDDFETVLRRIDPSQAGPLWAHYREKGVPHANANKAGFEAQRKELSAMSPAIEAALHQRYALDFELFGFEPAGWGEVP